MGTLLQLRLPLVTTIAAVLFAATLAFVPSYAGFPLAMPVSWAGPLVAYLVFGYAAASLVLGAFACVRAMLYPLPALPWLPARIATGAQPLQPEPLPAQDGGRAQSLPAELPAAPEFESSPAKSGRPYVRWSATLAPAAFSGSRWLRTGARRVAQALARKPVGRHTLAAGLLALLVLLEGLSHVGAQSGFWATSRPRGEGDFKTADGHVIWLEGLPILEDAQHSLRGLEVLSGRLPPEEIDVAARAGRTAYAFLVALLARWTGPLGSVYAAFVVINLLLWWGAALAVYDLARRARRSWWAGIIAGSLVATGLGFTFMAGTPMSHAAGYAAVPLVLWLMERLHVFRRQARWSDELLSASIAGAAGLINSLTPMFLAFTFFHYVGRAELRRLLLWAVGVLGVGVVWKRLLEWTAGPATLDRLAGSLQALSPWLLCLLILMVLLRLPRRWGEWCVGCAAVAGGTAVLGLAARAPDLLLAQAAPLFSALHLPEYLLWSGTLRPPAGALASSALAIPEAIQHLRFDLNLLAAFPLAWWLPALIGLIRLPRRWREWCVAVIVSAGLVAYTMIAVTNATPHPRLAYLAYPGIYLLAASGALNVHDAARWLLTRGSRLAPRLATGLAVAVTLACLLPALAVSNASLWGDWSFDQAFHGIDWH